jgi:selenocysteine lyase/cysteine desulfurase
MEKIREHEQELVKYGLERFTKLKEKVKLIGPKTKDRTAVFSFFIPENKNFNNI